MELNHRLGVFTLRNISSQLAGLPTIKVSFTIDIDAMLSVSAIDLDTENEISIDIEWDKRSGNTEKTKVEVIQDKTNSRKYVLLKIQPRYSSSAHLN